jgi:isoaspartyl peptidase/L-asparaginase-like protein (Ntn-hydrolase superfamily)
MCAQVSYAHGWHDARKTALANEQQKQQQPQKQEQELNQKQDNKQKQKQPQKQKQKRKQEQEQEQNGGETAVGALAADGVEARMSQPLRTHAQTNLV